MQTISKNLLPWKEFYENSHFSDLKKSICVCMKGENCMEKANFVKKKITKKSHIQAATSSEHQENHIICKNHSSYSEASKPDTNLAAHNNLVQENHEEDHRQGATLAEHPLNRSAFKMSLWWEFVAMWRPNRS